MSKDLTQVLTYVETGNAEAGFVWDTIALTSDKVRIVAVAPSNSHMDKKRSIEMELLKMIQQQMAEIVDKMSWQEEKVQVINTRALTVEEAIGNPERQDYPIQKGKEVMLETVFKGHKGQAFTDQPGNFTGTLQDVLNLPLQSNFERAVLIATLNALLRSLGKVDKTVHCRDQEPGLCAQHLVEVVRERFGNPRIAFIGLQPGMIGALSKEFDLRVADLDPENVGKIKAGVLIEDVSHTQEIIDWGDIVLATGSTSVNNSIRDLVGKKPVIFYGVTIAGVAHLNGFEQYCYCGH